MTLYKERLIEIIHKHFSLDKKSKEIINDKIMNPDIPLEYSGIELDENHRRYWKLEDEKIMESIDGGWKLFCSNFKSFVEAYGVSYKDFRENKVKIGKNYIKLQKAVYNFACKNRIDMLRYSGMMEFFEAPSLRFPHINNWLRDSPVSQIIAKQEQKKMLNFEDVYEALKRRKIDFTYENILQYVENYLKRDINNFFEHIGSHSLPKKQDLYLVFTKNPVDMFFCSTGEKWSSCLNLEGRYPFWTGLPNAIIDKNRAMIYITNKETKSMYNLFTLDKMLIRSWVLLVNKEEDKTKAFAKIVKFYPTKIDEDAVTDFLNKKIKSIEFISKEKLQELYLYKPFFSIYPLDLVQTEKGVSQFIYNDTTSIAMKENDNKFYHLVDFCSSLCYIKNKTLFDNCAFGEIDDGLGFFMKANKNVEEYARENTDYCSRCGALCDIDDMYYDDGSYYCYDCYHGDDEDDDDYRY